MQIFIDSINPMDYNLKKQFSTCIGERRPLT